MNNNKSSGILIVLAGIYTVALVVSNIIAGKLWLSPWGSIFTTGVWLFPIVYIIGDVVPEVYGLATARKVIFLGFGLNLFAVAFFTLSLDLPAPGFWTGQEAFQTVLGYTPRLLVASFAGFLVGSNVNAWVMVAMKKLTGGHLLWSRTITSTIFGESIDTAIFATIAFFGTMPGSALLNLIISMSAFKILYETVATPLTYLVIGWVKGQVGSQVEWEGAND